MAVQPEQNKTFSRCKALFLLLNHRTDENCNSSIYAVME